MCNNMSDRNVRQVRHRAQPSARHVVQRWYTGGTPNRTDLNVSRRLRRMLKAIGLPRIGQAHTLRMRFVQVTHILLMLQGDCTYHRIVVAMRELLDGWAPAEEHHSEVGGYQHRLLNVVDDIHTEIEHMAHGEWVGF